MVSDTVGANGLMPAHLACSSLGSLPADRPSLYALDHALVWSQVHAYLGSLWRKGPVRVSFRRRRLPTSSVNASGVAKGSYLLREAGCPISLPSRTVREKPGCDRGPVLEENPGVVVVNA